MITAVRESIFPVCLRGGWGSRHLKHDIAFPHHGQKDPAAKQDMSKTGHAKTGHVLHVLFSTCPTPVTGVGHETCPVSVSGKNRACFDVLFSNENRTSKQDMS